MALVLKNGDPNLKLIDDAQTLLKQSAKKMNEVAEKAMAEKAESAKQQALRETIEKTKKALEEANKKMQKEGNKDLTKKFDQLIEKVKESEIAIKQKQGPNTKEVIDKVQETVKEINKKEKELQAKRERLQIAEKQNESLLSALTADLKKTEESFLNSQISNKVNPKLKRENNSTSPFAIENLVATTGTPGPRSRSGGGGTVTSAQILADRLLNPPSESGNSITNIRI